MPSANIKLWQRSRTWWDDPRLMQTREAWIDQQIQMIDDITRVIPNRYASENEWRATVAEAACDARNYRRTPFPTEPEAFWSVHVMRKTWAEEAMMFFALSEPIAERFDLAAHGESMRRHQVERILWRPFHLIPGPPGRTYPHPVPEQGLTHAWWENGDLQRLRQTTVPSLLAQNDALAQIFSDDPSLSVAAGRDWLVEHQGFGWPLRRSHEDLRLSTEQSHFERGVFALMRGFMGEVRDFTSHGLPICQTYDPSNLRTVRAAQDATYETPYLTRGSPGW